MDIMVHAQIDLEEYGMLKANIAVTILNAFYKNIDVFGNDSLPLVNAMHP